MATATSEDEKDWDEDGVVRAKIQTFSTLHSPTATCQVLLKSRNLIERYFCLAMQTTTFRAKHLFHYTTVIVQKNPDFGSQSNDIFDPENIRISS